MASNKLFNTGTVKIKINRLYIRQDGCSAVALQVLIDREKKTIDTGIKWPIDFFKNEQCQPRFKNDAEYSDNNMILQELKGRATRIFRDYRLMNRHINMEAFMYDFASNFSADDFLAYMHKQIIRRWNDGIITDGTKKGHMVVYNKLKKWKSPLTFSTIDNRTAEQFETYMVKVEKLSSMNTRGSKHKVFKAYLNEARRDGFRFIDPYKDFKLRQIDGKYDALNTNELKDLYDFYLKNDFTKLEGHALRRFIFMCFTGLRISDALQFEPAEMIKDGMIKLEMHKTRKLEKVVKVPIGIVAQKLIDDGLEKCNGMRPFIKPSEQVGNRMIKRIGQKLEIDKNLHNHVGRETFATLYMEADGKLEVLQELLGHHDITMTRRYVKVTDERKKEEGKRIDGFI
uniref:tyrosine-type recombinase/integrase n=1 Tax=Roseivirga sp. TaxID=1964215 RepID=UPI004048A576